MHYFIKTLTFSIICVVRMRVIPRFLRLLFRMMEKVSEMMK